ncbi:hypothetical protein M408DRAFT_325641 [Serendipita vermifera MAFF 305830]|uniref:Uncharacterized protein n=1 Tax=Serendipita vermifera MAFF 305830 TaxID=933852 RepID=A0A0C2X7Y6_SERVB|nr:hypothetical protein M408DRAFT_325641 [Serendipita vermifera MAFF 305830]
MHFTTIFGTVALLLASMATASPIPDTSIRAPVASSSPTRATTDGSNVSTRVVSADDSATTRTVTIIGPDGTPDYWLCTAAGCFQGWKK